MPLSKELEDFNKRYKSLADKLKPKSNQSPVQMIFNDITKTFIDRFRDLEKLIPETMSDAMQAGDGDDAKKDVDKDKDVKLRFRDYQNTHESIKTGVKDLMSASKDAKPLEREIKKLKDDVDRKYGKSPSGPEKKDIERLKSDIEKLRTDCEFAAKVQGKLPKDAYDIIKEDPKKKYDKFIDDAEKLPKKKVEPLPSELEKVPYAKLKIEMGETEKILKDTLKKFPEMIEDFKKEPKKNPDPEKFVNEIKLKAATLSAQADKFQKDQTKCKIAIAKAPHIKDFGDVVTKIKGQADKMKKLHKDLKTALGKADD